MSPLGWPLILVAAGTALVVLAIVANRLIRRRLVEASQNRYYRRVRRIRRIEQENTPKKNVIRAL
jgi:hypothetical protein